MPTHNKRNGVSDSLHLAYNISPMPTGIGPRKSRGVEKINGHPPGPRGLKESKQKSTDSPENGNGGSYKPQLGQGGMQLEAGREERKDAFVFPSQQKARLASKFPVFSRIFALQLGPQCSVG
jgi:hypothetical protein